MDSQGETCNEDKSEGTRMWTENEYKTFELYERGNSNARLDVEKCLKEYSHKFKWPEGKSRVLDIGSGDGSVTTVLSKYLPSNCGITGSDINEKIVRYANHKHGNERLKFIQFDILGEVPEGMKGQFDHVFASYVFHWVREHEKAFTNIYNILPKGGEFFCIFLAMCDIYSVLQILAKRRKWAQWLENVNEVVISPYHDYQDPDIHVSNVLKKVGFNVVDARSKQRSYVHDIEDFKSLITGISCFDIPKHMWSDFLDDIIEVKRYNNLVDDDKGTVKMIYNLIVFHCTK